MKLEISLFSNGSMLSKYSDGRPAYRYSGDWRKLKLLERDIILYKKSGLPSNERVTVVESHFVVAKGKDFKSLEINFNDLKELIKLIKSK